MLEYIIFSPGNRKTRTSTDIYSPLVANGKGPGCRIERPRSNSTQNFAQPSVEAGVKHRPGKLSVLDLDAHDEHHLTPDSRIPD